MALPHKLHPNRSTTSTHGVASASRSSIWTGRWRRSADAELVGFGGPVGVASPLKVRLMGRSRRATPHIGTPWGLFWGPRTDETNYHQ